MASNDVKLLGSWPSPYVYRAKIALNIKEVAYEFFEEVYSNKSELLLKSNPIYKKVPVLIHNDKPISESMVIVQYIDEVWEGPSILPSDPLERSKARFWAYYIDDKLHTSYRSIIANKSTEEAKVQGVEQTVSCLKLLEDYLEDKPFFGGDEIGYVDIALGSRLAWFKVVEEVENVKLLDEERLPNLVKWAERFWLNDIVNGVMPEHNKLVEYWKLHEKAWKSRPAN